MTVNDWLDSLPRTRVACHGRARSAFHVCGVVGAFLGAGVTMGAAVLLGRSPAVTVLSALVCAAGFFGWVYGKRLLFGSRRLVLFEHLWLALGLLWVALTLMREPVAPYLDLVCAGIAWFLALGRVGCLLAGCCHGRPSEFGVRYRNCNTWPGFDERYLGLRLFPAPAIECLGLALIGIACMLALPLAPPGRVTAFFLIAYAILRFAVEGLRGDRRPHFWGLSFGRWGALVEATATMAWVERRNPAHWYLLLASLAVLAVFHLVLRRADPRRTLLDAGHIEEIRRLAASWSGTAGRTPSTGETPAGLVLGLSRHEKAVWHLSLSLRDGVPDLPLLCELATACFPALDSFSSRYSSSGVLHVLSNRLEGAGGSPPDWFPLYRAVLLGSRHAERGQQEEGESATGASTTWYFSAGR
jgi:Prolipoprotein diacylglyceryl transferase